MADLRKKPCTPAPNQTIDETKSVKTNRRPVAGADHGRRTRQALGRLDEMVKAWEAKFGGVKTE
jgi:hypothetical protein